MKKFIALSLYMAFALFTSVHSTQAMAIGKGFYLQAGGGSASWDAEDSYGNKFSYDSDTSHVGLGFVLDTATARDRLFNYRFQVGYEKFDDKVSGSSADMKTDSLVIDQDFGFGLVRNQGMRFWLGPELRISFSEGTFQGVPNYNIGLFGIGLGPVVGINIHTAPRMSMSFKAGFMAMSYSGVGDDTSSFNNDVTYTVSENYGFVNFSLLFR